MQEVHVDVMSATPKSANRIQLAFRSKIKHIYRQHAPDKLSRLSELYQKYDGLEVTWLQRLRDKYGSTF